MLHDAVAKHCKLHHSQEKALARLKIQTLHDLLYHFPARYERAGDRQSVGNLVTGTDAVVFGTICKPQARKTWKSKRAMGEAWLEDGTGRIKLMWFNQPYITKMLVDGSMVKVSGRIEGNTSRYIANPEVERVSELPVGGKDTVFGSETEKHELFAVYPETRGITSRWFRHTIGKVLQKIPTEEYKEVIPEKALRTYTLPCLHTALIWIHQPKKEQHYIAARKRFSFEEIFVLQTSKQQQRKVLDLQPTYSIQDGERHAEEFISRLPFLLTNGQQQAIDAILRDISTPPAMSRLLEGDVGSGKTAVAAALAYTIVKTPPKERPSATLQVAYMAPTEILAEQHFTSFVEYFGHLPIQLGLITSSGCKKYPSKVNPSTPTKISKTQLLTWVENGEIAMLVGTHALIQKNVRFRDLGLVIIDEQHRFGVDQRAKLFGRGKTQTEQSPLSVPRPSAPVPHLLSMTATPIPRTLALTLYGDLDLTVLDEMPPGRKPVITQVVVPHRRDGMYAEVRKRLDEGRQAYVICPRIEEPDPQKAASVQTKAVATETERLKQKEFSGYRLAMLHGQMKPKEKEEIMRAFLNHEIDVLVATSVVEVGVNIPNATTIVIEGAERFGLAQLHQLRGRVIRSTHQAYCYALTSDGGSSRRLQAFVNAKNGFELAEQDLTIRGPGELYGRSQSGITDLGMEALKNIKMVEAARNEARSIIENDPTLQKYFTLQEAIKTRGKKIHFE